MAAVSTLLQIRRVLAGARLRSGTTIAPQESRPTLPASPHVLEGHPGLHHATEQSRSQTHGALYREPRKLADDIGAVCRFGLKAHSEDCAQMSHPACYVYEFGPFRLETGRCQLSRDGQPVALPAASLHLLLPMVERHRDWMERAELVRILASHSPGASRQLNRHISALREALGSDDSGDPYIEVSARLGYRFVPNSSSYRVWTTCPSSVPRTRYSMKWRNS